MLGQRGALKGKDVARITFNEITRRAVQYGGASARPRRAAIDAYLARRALDTWSATPSRRCCGAVPAAARRARAVGALRLICEREAEIEAFRPREYWTIEGRFLTPPAPPSRRG